MSLVRFKGSNHPQQVAVSGAKDEVDSRATDPAVFSAIESMLECKFSIDVAASPSNTKCHRFFTREEDGLAQSWEGETVWCNPPYSNIRPWVEKAWHQAQYCPMIAMILPANRTEQTWWQELVEPIRDRGKGLSVRFLPGRIRFIRAGKDAIGPNERPPFGMCLLVWKTDGAQSN